MIHLSPDVASLPRIPYPTTKWCDRCKTYFVLLPGKEGLACKCRYLTARPLMVDLTGIKTSRFKRIRRPTPTLPAVTGKYTT